MSAITDTIRSIAKIALQSRPVSRRPEPRHGRIIVMGNGPSLNDTIAAHADVLRSSVTMAVNFAALAPVFFDIRPAYYVMADPHFFTEATEGNLAELRRQLARVDWPVTLFVPARFRRLAGQYYPALTVRTFNAVGVEGWTPLTHFAYRHGLGMPRPRNVLIPSIMLAISEGFDEVVITGADHSWMQTLSVTDDNEVVSVQPHFYADSEHETTRIRHEYRGYRLHQIVESFAVAFRSYHQIAAYASARGVRIVNATPGSFIDAFGRGPLA